jgi:hypothetical protein
MIVGLAPVPQSAAHQCRNQPHTRAAISHTPWAAISPNQLHPRAIISCTPGPQSAAHQGRDQPHTRATISHTPWPGSATHQGLDQLHTRATKPINQMLGRNHPSGQSTVSSDSLCSGPRSGTCLYQKSNNNKLNDFRFCLAARRRSVFFSPSKGKN